jgi:hypothetical protein
MVISREIRAIFSTSNRSSIISLLLLVVLVTAILLIVFLFSPQKSEIRQQVVEGGNTNHTVTVGPQHTYYVSPTGRDSSNGSQAHPFATIQKAADDATPGTIIYVAPGNYPHSIISGVSGTVTARITFISARKWGAKIRSTGTKITWENQGDYVDIVGFDISGDGSEGILNLASYVRIIGNHVHNIPASPCNNNGGAGINDGNYAAHDNDIIGNVVHDIGPINTPCNFAQGIYHSNLRGHICNNISYRNSGFGIHLWHAANAVTIANNLVFENGSGGMVIGAGDAPGGVTADNCVVANNIAIHNGQYGIFEDGNTGTHNRYLNNLVYANPVNFSLQNGNTATATITADPQFVNYQPDGSGDYHLTATSPAIDAGTNIGAPTTDIDGVSRPQGKGWDIGPYEYIST